MEFWSLCAPHSRDTRYYRILPILSLCLAACTLLDRSSPPQIVEVTTDRGTSVGRGREVNITLFTEDADNDELDYRWIASGGVFTSSKNDTLIDLFQDSVKVVWKAPAEVGFYDLTVEVSDGVTGEGSTQIVQIAVTQGSPIAVLEPDRVVAFRDDLSVTIDGTGSNDPDDDELKYFWRQILGPAVQLQSATGPTPFFDPPAPADYVFELSVSDEVLTGVGDTSAVDNVVIRVSDR